MFYLTTHSTHFIYGYMASDIWLRTILIVRKETRWHHIGYSFRLTARVLLYAPSHRQDSTYHNLCYTSHGALAGTRNSSMVHPMKDRSDDPPHHERTLYLSATSRSTWQDDSNGAVANKLHSVKLLQAVQEDWNCFVVPASVIQLIACPPLKRSVVGSILLSGPSCSLGYFPFQPVVHNW